RTGTFSVGAGYSSQDGVIGMVSVGDTNFRGTGDAVSITYEMSGDDTDAHGYSVSYRHPWIDKKQTVGTIRVYNRTYEYDDYNSDGDYLESYMRKYSGGELTFGRPVSEYSTNYITLRNRKDEYKRHTESGLYKDRSTEEYKGWRDYNFGLTRSLTLSHVTDTRDNIYFPTSGGRVSITGELGGFGGDFSYRKADIEDQRYFKAGHAQVWALRGQYGWGSGHLSEFARYKVGGQDSLRGYRDDQFRGERMFLATLEYRFPIVSKVQGAIFTDWGGAWDDGLWPDEVKGSVGIGMSLTTPLGPIRLDYGRGDDGGRVHFSVGGTF
ncbi:MAG: BamA/TamA family outer membrane protein, partial [Selenomonas sp.]|nr:BamA/TamA family outer membrane protein [Selenomonas sp.]